VTRSTWTLALPDSVRELLAQWLAPAAAKSNGLDHHPPPVAKATPRPADNPANARTAEQKLLAAMREHPGLGVVGLAKIVGSSLSTTKERLRRMAGQELIEKAPDGRWQVKPEEPRSQPAREEPGPMLAAPN
jgi:hypothetical protein